MQDSTHAKVLLSEARKFDPELVRLEPGDIVKPLPACVPEFIRERITQETKGEQVCPFVPLWPENYAAADLVFVSLVQHKRHMWPAAWESATAGMDADERAELFALVSGALDGEAVTQKLYPPKTTAAKSRGPREE